MKKVILSLLFSIIAMVSMQAQSIVGKWKTIDDQTGKAKSVVEITEKNGVYYGKVIEILSENKNAICDKCPADRKGKPIKGLTIINGMKKEGAEFSGGKILDPVSGKEYKCIIKLNGANKLDVRGYVGISALGRTQTWTRM